MWVWTSRTRAGSYSSSSSSQMRRSRSVGAMSAVSSGVIRTSMAAAGGVALRHGGGEISGGFAGGEAIGREGGEVDRGFAVGDELSEVVAGGGVVAEAAGVEADADEEVFDSAEGSDDRLAVHREGYEADALFFPHDIGEAGDETGEARDGGDEQVGRVLGAIEAENEVADFHVVAVGRFGADQDAVAVGGANVAEERI